MTLADENERLKNALRYIAGFAVAGYGPHLLSDEVAKEVLSETESVIHDEKSSSGANDLLHELATALRDLSLWAALFEQNPSDEHRRALNAANDEAEGLLGDFVLRYGDIQAPQVLLRNTPESEISQHGLGTPENLVLEAAEKGIGSLLWVMNNRHNWAHPRWDGLAESAEIDARKALGLIRSALGSSTPSTSDSKRGEA